MILEDFHVHTTFCDGKNTPEDMVRAALDLGMKRVGFSGHAPVPFGEEFSMTNEGTKEYAQVIGELKEKYKDKIEILCGLEIDYFSPEPEIETDYVIGSVHFVQAGNEFLEVDNSEEIQKENVNKYFGGDFFAFAEEYYKLVGDVIDKTKGNIVGHLDLVTKFNQDGKLFDTSEPRYRNAARGAIDKLIAKGKPFEINTGAISRGYRKEAYPELSLLEYIAKKGGRVILSSDSHSANTLCYGFEEYERLARDLGFSNFRF